MTSKIYEIPTCPECGTVLNTVNTVATYVKTTILRTDGSMSDLEPKFCSNDLYECPDCTCDVTEALEEFLNAFV